MLNLDEKKGFIPQIAGLRAFSVLVVILFHIDEQLVPSGFLGVDIFFVISGYVITKSIIAHMDIEGRFSILDFYVRRIIRIYPALIVCIFITIVSLALFGDYRYFESYLVSSIYALLGLSNIHFFKLGDDYFSQNLINPFLHTWSLGVEEQFYFIYPVLLFFILIFFSVKNKYKIVNVISLVLLISTFSIYLSDYTVSNFYLPTSRLWELSLGCLAFTLHRVPTDKSHFISMIAIATIGVFVFLDPIFYEKIFTFITCVSTFILIRGFKHNNFVLLRLKPIVFLGNISYSTYLYHLPVIYFTDLYIDDSYFLVLSILLSYMFAVFSYICVEKFALRFITLRKFIKHNIRYGPILILVIIIYLSFNGLSETRNFIRKGINETVKNVEKINLVKNDKLSEHRYKAYYNFNGVDYMECHQKSLDVKYYLNNCYQKKGASSLIYIFGDSFSQQYLPMIDSSKNSFDIISTSWNGSTFFPMLFSEGKEMLEFSGKVIKQVNKNIKYEKIYLVIGGAYYNYFGQGKRNKKYPAYYHSSLSEYYSDLEKIFIDYILDLPENVEVILLATPPQPNLSIGQCLFRSELSGTDPSLKKCSFKKNRDLRELTFLRNVSNATKSNIFDPYDFFCPGHYCSFTNEKNEVITHDLRHITIEASISTSLFFDQWFQEVFSVPHN